MLGFPYAIPLVFVLGTAYFLYVSRNALRRPGSHGFARFFAFEAILCLALVNHPHWEHDPFAPHQLASWTLLLLSIVLVIAAVRLLRRVGRHDDHRDDPSLMGFEKTSTLVTEGIFGWIRHPMYASLLALAWGIYFKDFSWASTALVAIATVALVVTARRDENECLAYFGAAYAEYMRRTKRFVPGVY